MQDPRVLSSCVLIGRDQLRGHFMPHCRGDVSPVLADRGHRDPMCNHSPCRHTYVCCLPKRLHPGVRVAPQHLGAAGRPGSEAEITRRQLFYCQKRCSRKISTARLPSSGLTGPLRLRDDGRGLQV
jgi:hypothetical protein